MKNYCCFRFRPFWLGLSTKLNKLNVDIIAIDINGANVKAGEFVENAFICDSTDEDALRNWNWKCRPCSCCFWL